jgi:hypothetical protein
MTGERSALIAIGSRDLRAALTPGPSLGGPEGEESVAAGRHFLDDPPRSRYACLKEFLREAIR